MKSPDNIDELNKTNIKKAKITNMSLDDDSLNKRAILTEFFDDKESFYSEYQNEPLWQKHFHAIFSGYKTYDDMSAYVIVTT